MANLQDFFQATSPEYPNRLADPRPGRPQIARAPLLLASLVLLCLVPRCLLASRTSVLCPDGVMYIQAARALNAGDLQGGFQIMHLNPFPLLLVVLYRMGLDWEIAGRIWGCVISSLVVLPLYGWARRQYDDRVALIACLLYAVNANFIRYSHEVIRDPTFWFLFMLSLYLLWRAVTEVRWWAFVAAGFAVSLAVLTRFEGLYLFIPVVLWTVWRFRALEEARWRLIVGAISCVAVGPALVVLVNLVWLRDHSHWELFRLAPLELVTSWLQSIFGSASGAAAGDGHTVGRMSSGAMALVLLRSIGRGLTPVFALLMLVGMWRWRRVFLRRDCLPLVLVGLVVIGGTWVHLYHAQGSSYRYPLPITLMGSTFAALGLLALSKGALQWARRRRWQPGWQTIAVVTPLLAVATIGVADALRRDYADREAWARLGHWIQEEYGPSPSMIGPQGTATIVNYYARGQCRLVSNDVNNDDFMELAEKYHPQVAVLLANRVDAQRHKVLGKRMKALGLEHVHQSRLPSGAEGVVVFARKREAATVAEQILRQQPRR